MSRMTIFALGIMPYISASIILQLLQVVWPLPREAVQGRRDGPEEDHPVHAVRHAPDLLRSGPGDRRLPAVACRAREARAIVPNPGLGFQFLTVLTLTTGTIFVMWLGEQISERGIGNGISLIIFAGIVVNFPRSLGSLVTGPQERGPWIPCGSSSWRP